MMGARETLKERVRAQAFDLGFAAVHFASTDGDPRLAVDLAAFIADGRHGDMDWRAPPNAARRYAASGPRRRA
jgi:epoxyqueuosine reductase QueG